MVEDEGFGVCWLYILVTSTFNVIIEKGLCIGVDSKFHDDICTSQNQILKKLAICHF